MNNLDYDVIIIGAGAAGLFCAWQAAERGARVLLIDHAKKIAEKIRISGGGRCNFTNIHCGPEHFLSANPHFCKSALKRFTAQDFVDLVDAHGIAWHEKKLGQLFCNDSAQQIIDMLVGGCEAHDARIEMECEVTDIAYKDGAYSIKTTRFDAQAPKLVIATGGLSIPKIGASGFGYDVARQFNVPVTPTRAALVPLTFSDEMRAVCKDMSGLSVEAEVTYDSARFAEGLLFTHRGLSGPSILQISSYWQDGQPLTINLAYGQDVLATLKAHKAEHPKHDIQNALAECVPKKLAAWICETLELKGKIAEMPDAALQNLADFVQYWSVKPNGTEGYRTAEVTLGGVDTDALSSKTMECKAQPGLYFIGEVVDVTGHLGGFNFQWAWASAHAAAEAIADS